MKKLGLAALVVLSTVQWATGLHAQSFRFPTYGGRSLQESVSTQDGTVCTQNVDGRASLNVGLYGDTTSSAQTNNISFIPQDGDSFGGFVMLNVPLSAPRRLNCAKLLEIEYERAKLRLKQEQMEVVEPVEQQTHNPLYQ